MVGQKTSLKNNATPFQNNHARIVQESRNLCKKYDSSIGSKKEQVGVKKYTNWCKSVCAKMEHT